MDINEKNRITADTDNIQGWLTQKEAEFLYDSAKSCTGNSVIVKIGSWRGKSTVWLSEGSKAGKKPQIFAIDPYTGGFEKKI